MKFSKTRTNKIVKELEGGGGRVRACKIANIHYSTFLDWMEKFPEFSEAIEKAEDDGNDKIKDMQKRKIIENKQWQSGAWWLERNYPDEFKERKYIDTKVTTDVSSLSTDELLKRAEAVKTIKEG